MASSLVEPFLNAFSDMFEAFGVPADIAPYAAIGVIALIGFAIFWNIVLGTIGDDNAKEYSPFLFVIFFVGLCVLGILPMWILLVTIIGGSVYLLIDHLTGEG